MSPGPRSTGAAFVGELGLDGSARPVRGAIALAMSCREHGPGRLFVPRGNLMEAAAVPGVEVVGIRTLRELIRILSGDIDFRPARHRPATAVAPHPDLREVRWTGSRKACAGDRGRGEDTAC